MPPKIFLHNHPDFLNIIRAAANHYSVEHPTLIEKDYWIMHCLYALQQQGFVFQMKGGTSLSKGFNIIHRFSEDIDIHIEPPPEMEVKSGHNHDKPKHIESRKKFYNWLSSEIKIDGIEVERDNDFDDQKFRNGGIKLNYQSATSSIEGVKENVLLEVGFAGIVPNTPCDISSWAYDFAADKLELVDNRAQGVLCYLPEYTLVEKLSALSKKYRQQQESNDFPINFMRHYYDVYALLAIPEVQKFIGTENYNKHKQKHFSEQDNLTIADNEAFILTDKDTRAEYENSYKGKSNLYYKGQPEFDDILSRIGEWADRL